MGGAFFDLSYLIPNIDLTPGSTARAVNDVILELNSRIETLESRVKELEKKDEPHSGAGSSFILKI